MKQDNNITVLIILSALIAVIGISGIFCVWLGLDWIWAGKLLLSAVIAFFCLLIMVVVVNIDSDRF